MYDPKKIERSRFAAALREGLIRKDMNQSDLAEALGVTHPTVSDWVNQKKTPGRRNLQKVIETLDLDWDYLTSARALPGTGRGELDDVILIPRLARVSAGDGYENGEETEELGGLYFSRQELRRLTNRDPKALRTVLVVGDSMEPLLRANDTVVYLPQRTIDDDGVYVLNIDESAKVKRVQRYGGGAVEIIPINPVYSREMFVPLEEADTPHLYRSRESGLVTRLEVEGKVVLHPRPL